MILVAHETGSRELLPIIQRIGEEAQLANLPYGDFAFEGNGPKGPMTIGVERKTLHDMLHCIDDARFAGFQAHGMRAFFGVRILIVEGLYKPHDNDGYLMEGFKGGAVYAACRYRSRVNPYSKLSNYLLSVSLSGIHVIRARDAYNTAYEICMAYRYFQKPWSAHTSMQEIQSLALAEVGGKPSLCRRWASQIDGIGVRLSSDIERYFMGKPRMLALASESDWANIKGLSQNTAKRIVREIWGS